MKKNLRKIVQIMIYHKFHDNYCIEVQYKE